MCCRHAAAPSRSRSRGSITTSCGNSAAQHHRAKRAAFRHSRQRVEKIGGARQRAAVDGDQQIAEQNSGSIRRFALGDRYDDERDVIRQIVALDERAPERDRMHADADERTTNVAVCEQLVDDRVHDGSRQRRRARRARTPSC
jgi:hypothetical protein